MNTLKHRLLTLRWPSFLTGWLLVLLVAAPFIFILGYMFMVNSSLTELSGYVDWSSILTTLLLIVSVAFISLVLGVVPAYVVVHYSFPLSRFFARGLILPLAIPGYVMAVIYSGIFGFGGEWQQTKALLFGGSWIEYNSIDIRNFTGLSVVLALSLFPYVFIAARSIFIHRSVRLEESALSLGTSRFTALRKIILPLALPGIIAGTGLVMMETLNDYGASAYYGVHTVTTEIFRCWNADLHHAMYFAGWVLIIPLVILLLQNQVQKEKTRKQTDHSVLQARKATSRKKWVFTFICLVPFLFGLIIPLGMLVKWTFANAQVFSHSSFGILIANSFQLAAIAALLTVLLALLIQHLFASNGYHLMPSVTRAGYLMPGAILAIGILCITTYFDGAIGLTYPNLLTGSVIVLLLAYVIRFLSVSLNPLNSIYRLKGRALTDSALSMGAHQWKIFWKIELPVYSPVLIATFILVFIDILKELPLTLLLRPFNFETLSTSVFQYAKVNESVPQAAPAALIIVLLGMVPVLLLQRYLHHGKGA